MVKRRKSSRANSPKKPYVRCGRKWLKFECFACDRQCSLTAPRDTADDDVDAFLVHSGFDRLDILGQDTWAKPSSWIALPADEWPITFFCCIHANVEHPDSYKPPPSRR